MRTREKSCLLLLLRADRMMTVPTRMLLLIRNRKRPACCGHQASVELRVLLLGREAAAWTAATRAEVVLRLQQLAQRGSHPDLLGAALLLRRLQQHAVDVGQTVAALPQPLADDDVATLRAASSCRERADGIEARTAGGDQDQTCGGGCGAAMAVWLRSPEK